MFTFDEREWHPKKRARDVHTATKTAMEFFGRPSVHHIVHSDAVQALLRSVVYQQDRDPGRLDYKVAKISTSAGNGTNGLPINILELTREAKGVAKLARESPATSARVYGRSLMNFIESPLRASLQGLSALRYDAREDISTIVAAGVPVVSEFLDQDYVIRPPEGAVIRFGSHMTPIISPETMINLAAA